MVAQRHNKLSYFTILAINGTSFFCAAFILMLGALEFYIESLMNDGKVPFLRSRLPYQYVCMGISPILCSLILIFPLAVVKNGAELSAVPLDAQYFETVSSNRRVGQEKQRREDVLAGTAFRLTFYSGTSRGAMQHRRSMFAIAFVGDSVGTSMLLQPAAGSTASLPPPSLVSCSFPRQATFVCPWPRYVCGIRGRHLAPLRLVR